MNWFKLLCHDLRAGLLRRRYLLAVPIFALNCFFFMTRLPAGMGGSWMDRLLFCFKGMQPVANASGFGLPITWFLTVAGCLLLNLDFLLDDLTEAGQQVIVRSVDRRGWYLSKCVWSLLACGLYLLLGALTALLITLLSGDPVSLTVTPEVTACTLEVWLEGPMSAAKALLVGLVLPWLTVSGFSLLQMSLCLCVKPVFAFLAGVSLLVVSLFFTTPWLPGNGAITARMTVLDPAALLLSTTGLIAVSILLGMIRFTHMDLLRYEG